MRSDVIVAAVAAAAEEEEEEDVCFVRSQGESLR
jgi:hypothetical protein